MHKWSMSDHENPSDLCKHLKNERTLPTLSQRLYEVDFSQTGDALPGFQPPALCECYDA